MIKPKDEEFWEESTENIEAHNAIMRLKRELGYLPDRVEVHFDGETCVANEIK